MYLHDTVYKNNYIKKISLLAKLANSQSNLFFKRAFPKMKTLNFISYIVDNSVFDHLLPYLKQNLKKRCSMKKGVPKNFPKFTEKHLCQSLHFNKAVGLRTSTLKRRLWHRCFPLNFAKFLSTPS